jgi:hypothetical protein
MRENPPLRVINTNVLRYTLTVVMQGQQCEVSFDYLSGVLAGNMAPALAAFQGAWDTANLTTFLDCISAEAALTTATAADLLPGTSPSFVHTYPGGSPGLALGSSYPTTVAALLRKQTSVKGQHGRGRMFMPAVPLSFTNPAVEANTLTPAAVLIYNAFLATLIGGTVAAGGQVWTYSLVTRAIAPLTIPGFGQEVQSVSTVPLLATVRRRREGRGI